MKLFKDVTLLVNDMLESGYHVVVEGGKYVTITENKKDVENLNCESFDCNGAFMTPSFIDPHVHLREPGFTYKEDFKTGTKAAVAGGYGAVCCMPNTNPCPDTPSKLEGIRQSAEAKSLNSCYFFGAITKNQKGKVLVDFEGLKNAGAIGFSDDGVGVQDAGIMEEAMREVRAINSIITAHCEDKSLLHGGYIHDGQYAKEHNHKGISSASESVQVARDVILAGETGVRYHVCHISAKESIDMVRYGKNQGYRVTAEVTPHHLLLSDKDLVDDGNYKMNPPLRSEEDKKALVRALQDGTIDCIATDHAPHSTGEKQRKLSGSPFGIIGLETAFPLLYTELVLNNIISLQRLCDALSKEPARIFRLPYEDICEGNHADFVLIDLDDEWTITKDFHSKSSNTPFLGKTVKSSIKGLFRQNKFVLWEGEFIYES